MKAHALILPRGGSQLAMVPAPHSPTSPLPELPNLWEDPIQFPEAATTSRDIMRGTSEAGGLPPWDTG